MNSFTGPHRAIHLPDDVEEAWLHLGQLVGAPVTQKPVELLERLGIVSAVALEGDARGFFGVGVNEIYRPGVAVGDRVLSAIGREKQKRERRGA